MKICSSLTLDPLRQYNLRMKNQTKNLIRIGLVSVSLLSTACVNQRLAKRSSPPAKEKEVVVVERKAPQERATIYSLGKNTFRFRLDEEDVWQAAIRVLMQNYNLTIIDPDSRVITTEWDSFYLNNDVYRNKISIYMQRRGRGEVDLTIHNNVEALKDGVVAGVGTIWVPAEDKAGESGRIIQNLAISLHQPAPMLPPHMAVARSVVDDGAIQR